MWVPNFIPRTVFIGGVRSTRSAHPGCGQPRQKASATRRQRKRWQCAMYKFNRLFSMSLLLFRCANICPFHYWKRSQHTLENSIVDYFLSYWLEIKMRAHHIAERKNRFYWLSLHGHRSSRFFSTTHVVLLTGISPFQKGTLSVHSTLFHNCLLRDSHSRGK